MQPDPQRRHDGANRNPDASVLDLPPLMPLVGGRWIEGEAPFPVLDKFTGEVIARVAGASREQVAQAVRETGRAFEKGAPPPHERARILRRTAELIERRKSRFADMIVAETGFTTADAEGEVDRALVTLSLSAEEATRIVGETVPFGASPGQHRRLGFTIRVPLGVICAITPFNSPLNTVLHKVGPALAAGNAVVLKPSALTPLTAALLCEALLEAGLPPGLLALMPGGGEQVGSWLLEEQEISFYTFTGSTKVGRIIQSAAGLRRTQLELGSIASTIVCSDADLDRAIPKIANAAFRKAGQVCTSVQRLYVQEGIAAELTERLAHQASGMPAGDPRDPKTRLGPMISEGAAQRAQSWVEEARLGQARIVQGGTRSGALMQPTVISDARSGMRVIDEEIFAPVICLLPFNDLDEAVAHANNTPYGLAAGVFTRDTSRAIEAAQALRFGAIHINETSSSRADGMPFGGVKDSGFGHEGPKYAVRELTEERLITLNP
jgi:succinate-semialdehyde dehydrogenase/glutarate-semialdehyde dehydrogenase